MSVTSLALSAGGSGDDTMDLVGITVWVDENGDGHVGFDEPSIWSGTSLASCGPTYRAKARGTSLPILTLCPLRCPSQMANLSRITISVGFSPRHHLCRDA